jgi:gamma-glutamylcyclotransferase (GGCT)/AIG2-like uncharacterized protein YtfP
VFVYGTLKRGGPNHPLLAPFVRAVTAGKVPGVLLELGGYPGWVDGGGIVRGEVFHLTRMADALRVLDALEEYHGSGDSRNLYDRVQTDVATPEGSVTAWAYRYVGPTDRARVVAGGVWGSEEPS